MVTQPLRVRTTSGARKMVKDKKDGGTISFEEYGYDLRTSMDVLDVDWNIPQSFPTSDIVVR